MKKYFILLFILLRNINSQQDLKFERISIEHGLSQSNVRCILQDKHGFLWLGTQDGLNRFDGYNFLVFKNIIGDSNSLSHNHIASLAEDKDGNIWIATALGGICRYNPITNTFKRYNKDKNIRNITTVNFVYVDKNNQLWAATYLIGLSKYNAAEDCFISFVHDKNNPESIPSNEIYSIYEDKESNLWLGSINAGLILFDRKKLTFKRYSPTDGLASNIVTSICENKEGDLVVGTMGGLSIFNKKNGFTNFYYDKNNPGGLSSNKIKSVFSDKKGNIYIGTEDGGINFLAAGENTFHKYRTEDKNSYSPTDNNIFSFYEDNSGNLWVGANKGLNKIKKMKKFDIFLGAESKELFSGAYIWAIMEDFDNNIWAGTDQGLFRINNESGKIKKITGAIAKDKIEEKIIYSLSQDKAGNIWIGSNSGLYCLDIKTNKILKYYYDRGDDSHYYNVIRSLLIKEDIIWIGTYARGVVKFDCKTKQFSPFEPLKGNTALFSKFIVFRINKDRSGNYWFCTSVGLFQYKPESDELIFSISTNDDESNEYNKLYNQSLCLYGNDDPFWIGTSGGGLLKYIPGRGIIKRYTEQDGLPNNVVYGILPDSTDNLWLSTNKGISKFNIKEETFKNYFMIDGLPSDEFNVGAFLKSSSGKFYFGSINGIVSFYPEENKSNSYPPPVAITSFKVFDKPYLKKQYLTDGEAIELSYSDKFFSFEFTALDFTSPEKNQYAYKLEGFDHDWMYIGNRRFASYTNIDAGEYLFKVKGSNNDGIWNEKGASIKLIIIPPFYRTWWAYNFYVIAFLAALFFLRQFELNKRKKKEEAVLKEEREKAKLREAHLRAEKAELQAKALESEKEIEKQQIRNRIASDLHDEIGSNLSSISLLSSLVKQNFPAEKNAELNGDIKKYLSEIENASRSSTESIRDIVWFVNPMSDQMNSLITKMRETANLMLSNIQFELNCFEIKPDEKINPELKRNLYLIYKEALNNIVKHSGAKFVKILVEEINKVFRIVIEDNGKGFIVNEAESGNGLKNLQFRAQQIKGDLKIDSVPGIGTKLELKFNVNT